MRLGDGRKTAFWLDDWGLGGALATRLPALFSHSIQPLATVQEVVDGGLRPNLAPRLSSVASSEMELLLAEIPSLHHDEDARVLRDCVDKKALTSSIYKLLTFAGTRCPVQAQFWSAKAPHKVRLFGWLVAKDRVHSKEIGRAHV